MKLFLTKEEDLCGWGRWGCFLTQTGGCWLGGNCREIAGRRPMAGGCDREIAGQIRNGGKGLIGKNGGLGTELEGKNRARDGK